MEFFIEGRPKPQSRPRAFSRGKFIKMYSPVTSWRKKVCLLAKMLPNMDGALSVDICYYFDRPKSHYRTGKYSHILKDSAPILMTSKPDIDNLNKAILDALGDAKLFKDDSCIVKIKASKEYLIGDQVEGASIKIVRVNH